MKVALLGAFNFPVPQGSQLYVAEQVRALRAAGCEATLFCYGRGDGRRLSDVPRRSIPAWLSPRRLRAGPSAAKPLADLALWTRLLAAAAGRRFDALLAHNVEAALVARAARPWLDAPVVYVAHTLSGEEIPTYLPAALSAPARSAGDLLDRLAVRGADAVLALSGHAAARLAPIARGPVAHLPPGLTPALPPETEAVRSACDRVGLERGGYAVYAGNLDGYQNLPLLDAVAERLPELPIAAVTHDLRGPRLPHLRRILTRDPEETRALIHGARLAVLPRRQAGGFPIKLLHYMEARLAIVGFAPVADTLSHGQSGWFLAPDEGVAAFAAAVRTCWGNASLRERLGAGARRVLETRHAWPRLVEETLDLLRAAGARD